MVIQLSDTMTRQIADIVLATSDGRMLLSGFLSGRELEGQYALNITEANLTPVEPVPVDPGVEYKTEVQAVKP